MTGLADSPGTEVEPACSSRPNLIAEDRADPRGLSFVEGGPLGVVLGQEDWPVGAPRLADRCSPDLVLSVRRAGGFIH